MSWAEQIEELVAEAFSKTTSPDLIHKGSQHAYKHAALQVQAAHVLATAQGALQARVSNLLAVAAGGVSGVSEEAAVQLRMEAYLEAVGLLGLLVDEEPGNYDND